MPESNGAAGGRNGHLLLLWSPSGYSLREREGEPPAVGQEIEEDGAMLVVTKVGASPLPDDPRPCAYSIGR